MKTHEHENARTVLRLLIADLEAKVANPQHYTEREREHNKKLLDIRRLELRDIEAARWGD